MSSSITTRLKRFRPSASMIVAVIALLAATGGSATAASLIITSKQIKNNSVTSADLRNNSATGADVKDGSLASADFAAGQLPQGERGAQGPQGPQGEPGATGPAGPRGANGATSVTVRSATSTTFGTFLGGPRPVAVANCQGDEKATGGSGQRGSGEPARQSRPAQLTGTPTGWRAEGDAAPPFGSASVTAYVICAAP